MRGKRAKGTVTTPPLGAAVAVAVAVVAAAAVIQERMPQEAVARAAALAAAGQAQDHSMQVAETTDGGRAAGPDQRCRYATAPTVLRAGVQCFRHSFSFAERVAQPTPPIQSLTLDVIEGSGNNWYGSCGGDRRRAGTLISLTNAASPKWRNVDR